MVCDRPISWSGLQKYISFTLNGGTIQDPATNNGVLNMALPGADNSLGANKALVIDTTPPTVTDVNSSTANGNFTIGGIIDETEDTLIDLIGYLFLYKVTIKKEKADEFESEKEILEMGGHVNINGTNIDSVDGLVYHYEKKEKKSKN